MHQSFAETSVLTQLTNELNEQQKQAVLQTEGPLLVLAGAGTGKTRVLTTRISHIIYNKKALPGQILAVTFTNKAANEIKHRIQEMLHLEVNGLYIGTFHAIAARIIRDNAEVLGYNRWFTIVNYDDQGKLIKTILKSFNIDDKEYPPKLVLYLIERLKDKAYTPETVPTSEYSGKLDATLIKIYKEYQIRLQQANAVDFGDIIMLNIKLFNERPDIFEQYQQRFKYILVDEYQDTNIAQYLWLRLLTQKNSNICCVGDDDQSIYGWRGAEVGNILNFEKHYPDAKVIRLEQNYRSTNHILGLANNLIAHNNKRHPKNLWTDIDNDEKVNLKQFYDDKEEARFLADEIEILSHKSPKFSIAILMRSSFQSRIIEQGLNFLQVPYTIVGGVKFFSRREIRDVISYIRLLVNPDDVMAFERVINTPKRGVGNASLQKILEVRRNTDNQNILEVAYSLVSSGALKGKAGNSIKHFVTQMRLWAQKLNTINSAELVELMLQESGYYEMWKNEKTDDAQERLQNIKELVRNVSEYEALPQFLEYVSSLSELDEQGTEAKVSLMTIHAAKGLEFDTVFLPGWEDGIFPSAKSVEETGEKGIEEERRLAYVAITRARKNLYITFTGSRMVHGRYQQAYPSMFLQELSPDHLNEQASYGNHSSSFIKKPKKLNTNFKLGASVFHTKFGYGDIIELGESFARVEFESGQIKDVSLEYLVPINQY